MIVDKKSYRYPGVQPFRTLDSDIFFGRSDEQNKLYKLLMLEKLVVLFGKSGYGKSSLINAGIIPILQDKSKQERFQYAPIHVRIGKVSGQPESPVQKVTLKLNEQFNDVPKWSFLDKCGHTSSFWYQFKKKQSPDANKFIIIFDQFEEFFTYPKKEQEVFRWELAELLFTTIPQYVRDQLENITDEQDTLLSAPLNIKVLFSIRSDRLSLLHSMKDALPTILQSTFEIKGLRANQAKDAITLPALIQDEKFITPPFSYKEDAMNIILKELSTVQGDGTESIESFQLQILCQACETRIEEMAKADTGPLKISMDDLPKFDNLYEAYYNRQIEKLPQELREDAQTILEGLIFEDPRSGECRRLSVDENILRGRYAYLDARQDMLSLLENTFLIRREINTVGGLSYELSHDTIIVPIIKIRNEARRRKQLELETEIIKKNAITDSARKRRKQAVKALIVLALLLAIGWYWKNFYFYYLTLTSAPSRPAVRQTTALNDIVSELARQNIRSAKLMNKDSTLESWESSQLMAGLKDEVDDSIKTNFWRLTSANLDARECCCWMEVKDQQDFRASGWIVSSIGDLHLTTRYNCNIIDFFIDNQLNDGSWSMLPINKKLIKYGSTYATCHVLRALQNSLPNIPDTATRARINGAIRRGAEWLLSKRKDASHALWNDYPSGNSFEVLMSLSLSGLALHTLNLIHYATPELNRQWIKNLRRSQASTTEITHKERSDVFYKLQAGDFSAVKKMTIQ